VLFDVQMLAEVFIVAFGHLTQFDTPIAPGSWIYHGDMFDNRDSAQHVMHTSSSFIAVNNNNITAGKEML
jgi:hypothetical protein